MNESQENLDHSAGNVGTLDDFEMPLPANESSVEWATKRIDSTVRRRQDEPDWSDTDIARFETAVRLCAGRNEGVRSRLRRRFSRSSGKLAGYIIQKSRHRTWKNFGKRLRGISPIFDAVFAMQAAIELIERCVTSNGVRNFPTPKGSCLIQEARDGVKQFRAELPIHIWQKFRGSMWSLQKELRERYTDPDWIALARMAHMPIPTIEWIRDVESAITVMADLTNSDPSVDPMAQRDPEVRHLCRVLRRFRLTSSCYLPVLVSERLLDAMFNFAEAMVERSRPHLLNLKNRLRIDRTPDGAGYTCSGVTQYPRVAANKLRLDSTCDKAEALGPLRPRLTLRFLRSLPDGARVTSNCLNGFSELLSATNREEVWEKAKMLCADGRTCCWVNPIFDWNRSSDD